MKTSTDKRGYQLLMFRTQHSGVTGDGKLPPTVSALLFGGSGFLIVKLVG